MYMFVCTYVRVNMMMNTRVLYCIVYHTDITIQDDQDIFRAINGENFHILCKSSEFSVHWVRPYELMNGY